MARSRPPAEGSMQRAPVEGEFDFRPLEHRTIGALSAWLPLYLRYWTRICTPSLAWWTAPRGRQGALFDGMIDLRRDDDPQWIAVDSINGSLGRVVSLRGCSMVEIRIRNRPERLVAYQRSIEVREDDVFLIRAHDGRGRWSYQRRQNWVESGWLSDYRLGRLLLSWARRADCQPPSSEQGEGWLPRKTLS